MVRSSGRLGYIAATIAMLAAPLTCEAQQGPCSAGTAAVSISPGTFTGAQLNSLTDDQFGMYAAGYIDALQAATMIGVNEHCRKALQACVIGSDRAYLVATIRKYLRENPNRWDEQSNNILYNVLFSHCLTKLNTDDAHTANNESLAPRPDHRLHRLRGSARDRAGLDAARRGRVFLVPGAYAGRKGSAFDSNPLGVEGSRNWYGQRSASVGFFPAFGRRAPVWAPQCSARCEMWCG